MAEQRVVIEVHLGVERHDLAVAGQDQRVDFRERRIGVVECLVQRLEEIPRLRNAVTRHADLARDVFGVLVGKALEGILDDDLVYFLGGLGCDLLDVHAALARGHQRHALGAAVNHHAEVQLLLDVGAFFDQQPAHLLALGTGLVRLQLHAEDPARMRLHLVERLGDLDATALAAAAGVDLGFHHPPASAELLRRLHRFVHAEARIAARGGDAVLAQDFLALVLVDFHL